jgi:hypothetical protein
MVRQQVMSATHNWYGASARRPGPRDPGERPDLLLARSCEGPGRSDAAQPGLAHPSLDGAAGKWVALTAPLGMDLAGAVDAVESECTCSINAVRALSLIACADGSRVFAALLVLGRSASRRPSGGGKIGSSRACRGGRRCGRRSLQSPGRAPPRRNRRRCLEDLFCSAHHPLLPLELGDPTCLVAGQARHCKDTEPKLASEVPSQLARPMDRASGVSAGSLLPSATTCPTASTSEVAER